MRLYRPERSAVGFTGLGSPAALCVKHEPASPVPLILFKVRVTGSPISLSAPSHWVSPASSDTREAVPVRQLCRTVSYPLLIENCAAVAHPGQELVTRKRSSRMGPPSGSQELEGTRHRKGGEHRYPLVGRLGKRGDGRRHARHFYRICHQEMSRRRGGRGASQRRQVGSTARWKHWPAGCSARLIG